tara:strand:+ start:131 stop:292 length:162 start_codon:yes stop_codon:yes gene_type:complete
VITDEGGKTELQINIQKTFSCSYSNIGIKILASVLIEMSLGAGYPTHRNTRKP